MRKQREKSGIATDLGVRTDEWGQADNTTIGKQLGDLTHTTDVLFTILRGEAEVLVQTGTHVVPIQTVRRNTVEAEVLLQGKTDGGFTSTRQTYGKYK